MEDLYNIAKNYIVDRECIKARNRNPSDVTIKEIQEMIKNYENIVVEDETGISIYCDDWFFAILNKRFLHSKDEVHATNKLQEMYQEGKLELYVKYSKKKPIGMYEVLNNYNVNLF